jgi:hypothetical protein
VGPSSWADSGNQVGAKLDPNSFQEEIKSQQKRIGNNKKAISPGDHPDTIPTLGAFSGPKIEPTSIYKKRA